MPLDCRTLCFLSFTLFGLSMNIKCWIFLLLFFSECRLYQPSNCRSFRETRTSWISSKKPSHVLLYVAKLIKFEFTSVLKTNNSQCQEVNLLAYKERNLTSFWLGLVCSNQDKWNSNSFLNDLSFGLVFVENFQLWKFDSNYNSNLDWLTYNPGLLLIQFQTVEIYAFLLCPCYQNKEHLFIFVSLL